MQYVAAHELGMVYMPRGVVQYEGSEVEPDLQVRQPLDDSAAWHAQPVPILVVEILSPSSRPKERAAKREFYRLVGVGEYWLVDTRRRVVTQIRANRNDIECSTTLTWHPDDATASLAVDVPTLLGGAAG